MAMDWATLKLTVVTESYGSVADRQIEMPYARRWPVAKAEIEAPVLRF